MLILHVYIHVLPDAIERFREATLANARQSVQEPGIVRFDVLGQNGDPTRFLLVEVYRSPAAIEEHRATTHYAKWRDTVANMMAEPRARTEYTNVFPADEDF